MQRISFDFMTRKLRQMFRESQSKRSQRKAMANKSLKEVIADEKQREFEKQFIPETRWGSFLTRKVAEGDSRQVRRRLLRIEKFNDITRRYSGEPRKNRRLMAFAYVQHFWKTKAA